MKASRTKELAAALFELTDGQSEADVHKAIKEFAAYLKKKGELSAEQAIIEEYGHLYNKRHDILEATVTLTERLPEAARTELRETLKKKHKAREVHLNEKIDQRLIGGMKVKIGDEVYDASIKNSLKQLQTQLLK